MLADAVSFLADTLSAHASVSITYKRGRASYTLTATLGQSVLRVSDRNGTRVERTDRDFLIVAADLPLIPERGDFIIYNGGFYEVLPVGSDPAYRYSDPYNTILRIHTKYKGTR